MTSLSILLTRTDYLHTVLFFRFRAPGKQPGGVRIVSIQMIMMRIFCQACGTPTRAPVTPVFQPGLDMSAINSRFVDFKSSSSSKPYQKQKSSLERQLPGFLASLSPPKSMPSVTSEDIVKFLISKDKTGRTIVHAKTCDRKIYKCPRRLAACSVDYREVARYL